MSLSDYYSGTMFRQIVSRKVANTLRILSDTTQQCTLFFTQNNNHTPSQKISLSMYSKTSTVYSKEKKEIIKEIKKPKEPEITDCCGCGCYGCPWMNYLGKLQEYEAHKKQQKQKQLK